MIIECDSCYARYKYDESRFEGKPSKKVRCTRCLAIFEVFNTRAFEAQPSTVSPRAPDDTVHSLSDPRGKPKDTTTRKNLAAMGARRAATELKLPPDSKLSLAVIAGPEAGKIYEIEKPRVVIGRQDVEIVVDDPEISRQHAALEVLGDKVTLIDLGSTNGTFVGGAPIQEAPLENQGEFTVGGSTLMLIVTAKGLREP